MRQNRRLIICVVMGHSIRLIHWNIVEAAERAERLIAAGFQVDHGMVNGSSVIRQIADGNHDAVVIDLSRLPSHGREVGLALREAKATQTIPLIFVDGEPSSVRHVRQIIPEVTHTSWLGVVAALKHVIAKRPNSGKNLRKTVAHRPLKTARR